MFNGPAKSGSRIVLRFALVGVTAALLAGCADSSRYIGDPLGNPFKSASGAPVSTEMAPPPSNYAPRPTPSYATPGYPYSASIVSQPLAPPSGLPARRVASYATPAHPSPRLANDYSAPRTERTASIPASSGRGGWSAAGGMAVIAATGESAAILGERYNVPEDALLRTNGFASSASIRPGTRVIIPVYSANGGGTPAPRTAQAEPARKPQDHASRKRLIAKSDAPAHEKLHWVKGPVPADKQMAATTHGRAKAMAKLDHAGKPQKMAKVETVQEKPVKMAKIETVQEKPVKVAAAPMRKVVPAIDPTPTASLPPANEKLASNGNPEFRWPAHGRIIQGFETGGNDGINIAVPEGTAVKAAESGVVAYTGNEIKGFGNLVLIRHPNGYVTAYANNGDIAVHRGEQVKRGQTIAKSGQSGNVASPQLHFEVRKGSTPVDPTRYLAGL